MRALLIGVSGYPSLPPAQRLQGPPTAVQRLRDALQRHGVAPERIRLLADGVAGAGLPTRAAILDALDTLARDTRESDVVVVHFAGHGSRQPDPERPGALAPTLLPLDIGAWDGGNQPVANALTRDELRSAIDRIAARGAFVWAVFDACHSSGLVRGEAAATATPGAAQPASGDAADARTVLAAWLAALDSEAPAAGSDGARRGGTGDGVGGTAPTSALPGASPGATARRPAAALTGGITHGRAAYFYAAQGSEATGEMQLPRSDAAARRHGLFSFVLTQLLEQARSPMTYRQLAEALLASYRTNPNARVTPVFAGNGLDALVLGQASVAVRQWPLQRNTDSAAPWWVAVGHLHGIAVGARFAVVPSALARDDEAIAQLEAVQVQDDHSRLMPVAAALPDAGGAKPSPAGAASAPSTNAALQPGMHQLRLVSNPPAFSLRVAFDAEGCATPCMLREAVQRLRSSRVDSVDLQWVDVAASSDLRLRAHQGRVMLLEAAQAARGPQAWADALALDLPAHTAPEALAQGLARRLHWHARLRNLSRLAARSALDANQAALESSLRRSGAPVPAGVGALAVRHGERVVLSLRNRSSEPLAVTVLYLDADEGIEKIYPTQFGDVNRLEAGEKREVGVRIGPPSTGAERIWAIAALLRPRDPSVDFGFLEQPALQRRRDGSATVIEIGEELAAFADAAFADHLRRGEPRPRPLSTRTLIRSHELEVSR